MYPTGFKKTLSSGEENRLLKQFDEGSADARNKLIEHNMRLVAHIVKKVYMVDEDVEDLISVGTIGLIKAIDSFDINKKAKLSTYASRCIENEVLMYGRQLKKEHGKVSLEFVLKQDSDGNEMTYEDLVEDEDSRFDEKIAANQIFCKVISIILNCFPRRETAILLGYVANMTQIKIMECLRPEYDISRTYINRIINRKIKEVKRIFLNNLLYEEVFFVKIVKDSYEISFSTNEVGNFKKALSDAIRDMIEKNAVMDAAVICKKDRCAIYIPAEPQSFEFIEKMFQKMDEFNLRMKLKIITPREFEDKNQEEKNVTEEANKPETVVRTKKSKKGEKTKEVLDFIMTQEEFSGREITDKFPNIPSPTIISLLSKAVSDGKLLKISRGMYKKVKEI